MTRRLVLGGLTLAVVLGVMVARRSEPPARYEASTSKSAAADPLLPREAEKHPELARAWATSQVFEGRSEKGLEIRGVGYDSRIQGDGFRFIGPDFFLQLSARSLERDGQAIPLSPGVPSRTAFGVAQINRGALIEEYVFENRRVEQLVRIPQAPGEGALRVNLSVQTDLTGNVLEVPREGGGWKEYPLQDGGLVFCSETGDRKLAYHGAMAIDARGRTIQMDAKYRAGQIQLEIPARYMAEATFPVVIDPWLQLDFSASGGGVTKAGLFTQTPALALNGSGDPYLAWVQNTGGNAEIMMRYWNGLAWFALGGSDTGGGVSATSGHSTNPAIAVDANSNIFIAWEEETTTGNHEIYLKKWDGTSWSGLKGSATLGGLSNSTGFSTYPTLALMDVPINSTGAVVTVPVVAWEDDTVLTTAIYAAAYYPGDPGIITTFNADGSIQTLGFPTIPEGWYGFGISKSFPNAATAGLSSTPGTAVSERASLAMQGVEPVIVWQDSRTSAGLTNYDIHGAKFFGTGFPGGIQAPINKSRNPDFTFGVWDAIEADPTGPLTGGGVSNISNSNADSRKPSLAIAPAGDAFVAWEEYTTPTAPDIHVQTSAFGGGMYAPFAGSGTNISGPKATKSVTPSIGINSAGVPYVAWQDDSPGNSEIFVKRFVGAAWVEAGYQSNSASTVFTGSPPAPAGIGGVSQTASLSLFPVLKASKTVSVAWEDQQNGAFEIFLRRFYSNNPLNLRQVDPVTGNTIPLGTNSGATIELRAVGFSEDETRRLLLEVEVQPISPPSLNTITQQSGLYTVDANPLNVPPTLPAPGTFHYTTAEMVATVTGLVNGTSYKWRARTRDNFGDTSPWYEPGTPGQVAFISNVGAAATPPIPLSGAPTVSVQGSNILVSWPVPTGGADSYIVKREDNLSGTFTQVATPVTNSFLDTTLVIGTTYRYVVAVVKGTFPPSSDSPPSIPITLSAAVVGAGTPSDSVDKSRCGLTGLEWMAGLAALALWRRRRR